MRAQPSCSSTTLTGSPASTWVTCSASLRGALRTAARWRTNVCSPRLRAVQLRLDAADRLVELVEERRGPVVADEAARRLFALRQAPVALARSLLAEVVDADSRLAWNGDAVGLARPLGADLLVEEASYVV